MSVPITYAPVKDRVDIRNHMRNLDKFLDYKFGENKKLTLIEDKVHGHAISSLKEMDSQHINWKSYPALWWNDSLNLRKITHFISTEVPVWTEALQLESKKMVKLELQCALLEKVVTKYNLKAKTADIKEEPISFVNPFRKTLRVSLNYPAVIDHSTRTTVIRDVFFDRLTSAAELAAGVKEAMDKPVLVKVIGSTLENGDLFFIPISVIPKSLFKKIVQEPEVLFDPSDDQPRGDDLVVNVTYGDHDDRALSSLLFKAGEQQSLPHVYEQGFIAGKIAGFNDALSKMKKAFSGQ